MLDFERIARSSRLYNFHSHTQFCDGHSTMEEFIVEAIAEGFTDYGFSPHSPIKISSPCNITFENVPKYLAEYERLKAIYCNDISLYLSMEIDYLNKDWGPSNSYFDTLPLDYRIGSVHFIPSFIDSSEFVDIDGRYSAFKEKMSKYFNNDIEQVVRSFYKQSLDMIEHGGFDIIGHFDKIGHNAGHFKEGIEDEDWYNALVRQTFDAIMDKHIIIEVNTKAWGEHNRFFPNLKYFELLHEYNAPIIINSDSHYHTLINAGRDDAFRLLGL